MRLSSKRGCVLATALALSSGLQHASDAATPARNGSEFRILRSTPGDQAHPDISLSAAGGYLVTEDTFIDGSGLGIRARRFFADLSGSPGSFQVNSQTAGDQRSARVAVLPNGGGVFTWQGSTPAGYRVFARFIAPDGTFYGPETRISLDESGSQQSAAPVVLKDGSIVIVWAAWNREKSASNPLQGVFGQRFSANGTRIGSEFQVNVREQDNQRNPAIAALSNGGFVVSWVSEDSSGSFNEELSPSNRITTIHTRIYDSNLNASGIIASSELGKICANPALIGVADRGFRLAWSQRIVGSSIDGWDVVTRTYDASGAPASGVERINTLTKGDQFVPKLSSIGEKQMIVWTSYGQDGSDEGIYGRLASYPSGFDGEETLVNTTTLSKQIHPAISSFGGNEFVTVWSSFTGGNASFDLFAQRFQISAGGSLAAPSAPIVSALGQSSISVTWPELPAESVERYLVYVDNGLTPRFVTGCLLTITEPGWTPASTHTISIAYQLKDGRTSPQSEAASIVTWGADNNNDGLPDDWQSLNWGKPANWPAASADSDGDGASNLSEFLAGTDPTDPASVLRTALSARETGLYLEWTTQPGNVYQVQTTADFASWDNFGTARFAASTSDSLSVSGPSQPRYYRVIRLR